MTFRISTHRRRLVQAGGLAAMGAIAAGAMVLTAPLGNAIPESTIASECDAAGGTYQTTVAADGKRYSQCCYRDIAGTKHCDNYVDGTYINTVDYAVVEGSPTPSPSSPTPSPSSRPGAEAGLPTTAAPTERSAPPEFGTATLYMPPPPGPAASQPGEVAQAP